ncbi:MAG: hypothetical protein C5B50_08505, partial [Verrucomicrobia bacterium]
GGEQFDLAILDMQMPGMDGLMLAEEIRKLPSGAKMPLVLLSSMRIRPDDPKFTWASFACYMTKPIKPAHLHEVLVSVISGAQAVEKKTPAATKLDPTLAARLPLRVLVCDDNVINQKVALRLFQQMGYRADVASNGKEALAALDRQSYDLIFMDLMMPEMGGLEATSIIRERQKQRDKFPNYKASIVVIAMTASAMQGDREKCLAVGMEDYISKPVRLEDIRAMVEKWGPVATAGMQEERTTAVETPNTKNQTPEKLQNSSSNASIAPNGHGAAGNGSANGNPNSLTEEIAPPVDMDRLNDFTDGDPEQLRELVTLYLSQTSEQIQKLEAAVAANSVQEVRRLAHSCAGASATCGMRRLVPMLRELEAQGANNKLTTAPGLCKEASQEFNRIRVFLEGKLAEQTELAGKG